jgi:hypothetical protein
VNNLVINGIYQHYENKLKYKVVGTAWHSETLEEMAIYQALYDAGERFGKNATWVRPKKMFVETLTINGMSVPRFKLISDE